MKSTMRIRSKWRDTRLYNWAYDIYLIKAYDWPTSKLFRKIRLGLRIASKQAEVEIEAVKKLTAEQFIDYKSEERARESEHEMNELEHEMNELEHEKESHSFMVKVIGIASACITIVGSMILIVFKDELSKLIFG